VVLTTVFLCVLTFVYSLRDAQEDRFVTDSPEETEIEKKPDNLTMRNHYGRFSHNGTDPMLHSEGVLKTQQHVSVADCGGAIDLGIIL
jgi:hypothetical protein